MDETGGGRQTSLGLPLGNKGDDDRGGSVRELEHGIHPEACTLDHILRWVCARPPPCHIIWRSHQTQMQQPAKHTCAQPVNVWHGGHGNVWHGGHGPVYLVSSQLHLMTSG